MTTPEFPELGFYGLAGQPASSRDLLDEVREGEALGLGSVFISERYNKKEAATLCGAAAAVSESITISCGVTRPGPRSGVRAPAGGRASGDAGRPDHRL